jgi:hypothetical protein
MVFDYCGFVGSRSTQLQFSVLKVRDEQEKDITKSSRIANLSTLVGTHLWAPDKQSFVVNEGCILHFRAQLIQRKRKPCDLQSWCIMNAWELIYNCQLCSH